MSDYHGKSNSWRKQDRVDNSPIIYTDTVRIYHLFNGGTIRYYRHTNMGVRFTYVYITHGKYEYSCARKTP